MALTRNLQHSVIDRLQNDADFQIGYIAEVIAHLEDGDIPIAKTLLTDYLAFLRQTTSKE